jgi:hypothetical protein
MADINQLISLGIGSPAGIPEFLTFGLQIGEQLSGWLPVDELQGGAWTPVTETQAASWSTINEVQGSLWTEVNETQG